MELLDFLSPISDATKSSKVTGIFHLKATLKVRISNKNHLKNAYRYAIICANKRISNSLNPWCSNQPPTNEKVEILNYPLSARTHTHRLAVLFALL